MNWKDEAIFSDDDRVISVAQEYQIAENEYLDKFGKDSLERVLELPHPITSSVSNYIATIGEFRNRIKQNRPFKQLTEEEWDRFIF